MTKRDSIVVHSLDSKCLVVSLCGWRLAPSSSIDVAPWPSLWQLTSPSCVEVSTHVWLYPVLLIISLHSVFMLPHSLCQAPSRFANIHFSQSMHGISYFAPFFSSAGLAFFTLIKLALRVCPNPSFFHSRSILSLTPRTYGK